MGRRLAIAARTVALAALTLEVGALGGSLAFGQTMTGMGNADGQQQAQAFATAQQPATAAVVPNADVTQVPNSGGDTTGLQAYQGNPSGLSAAGQSAAVTSDSLNTAMLAKANANQSVVKNTDSWLQQSLNIIQNPTSVLPSTGSQQQSCTTTQSQQTVTSNDGTYTCETSQQVTDSQQTCTQTLVVDTSSTYTYACTNSYDVNARTWNISSACAALGASSSCQATGETCSTPDPGEFRATQCTKGTEWNSSNQTCQSGTGWSQASQTCDPVRDITVADNYVYDGSRDWNGSTWAPDGPESALQGAGSTCQVQATNCTAKSNVPPNSSCTDGTGTGTTSGVCFLGWRDISTLSTSEYPAGYNYYYPAFNIEGMGFTTAQVGTVVANFQAATNGNCTSRATQVSSYLNSINVNVVEIDGAIFCKRPITTSLPAGAVLKWGIAPAWTTPAQTASIEGSLTYGPNPYSAKSGLYFEGDMASNIGPTPCQLLKGTCSLSKIDEEEGNYTCSTTVQLPACVTPQGMVQQSTSCALTDANGNCIETTHYYVDPTGGCDAWTNQWLCTAQVSGAGTPVSIQPYVSSDTWSNACDALVSTPGCSKTSETVEQGPATRDIDGLDVYRDSWQLHDTYTCNVGTGVNTCTGVSGCTLSSQTCAQNDPNTGQCALYNDTYTCWSSQPIDGCTGNENGCTQTGSTCAGTDQNGNCSVWTYAYSCPVDDGSGGCLAQTNTYSCSADVPPADPAQNVVTVETGTHWDQTCQQSNDPTCQSQGTTCNDANSTKTINGIQVTASCWSQTTNYECEAKGAVQSDCNPPAGCTWDHDQCLDDPPPTDGSCTSMDDVYKCQEQTNKTVTQSSCTTQMCFSGQCFSISGANDSNDLGKAFSALSVGQMAGANYANAVDNLKIMSGTSMRCRKAVLGFSNCCKDSGWGESLGLAQCDDQEKQLIKQQETKACHYVGTYCSNKSFFGVCLQKSMRYCCFEGSLARIVNEAGRPQVGKTWGSAKNADCSGFTIDQFQQLDLSNVDFSDFYSQALSGLTEPSASSATSNIQSTLNTLYSGGTPVNSAAMPQLPPGP